MTDLAKTIAQACLDHIQARPDTPTEQELADVVRPLLQIQHAPPYDEGADIAGLYDPPHPSPQELYDAKLRELIALAEGVEHEPGDLLCYSIGNCVVFECDWPYPSTPEAPDGE